MKENTVQRGMAAPQNLARMEVGAKLSGSGKVEVGSDGSDATALLLSVVPFAKKKTTAIASIHVGREETAQTRRRTSSATASQE